MGVSTGLAYTGAGGDILRIETVVAPGKGDFHLTGQLGEVMQESVTAAWGYLKTAIARDERLGVLWDMSPGRGLPGRALLAGRSRRRDAGAAGETGRTRGGRDRRSASGQPRGESRPGPTDHELLSALEVRMHLPEGAVPKEGPSAGIAVAVSLLSALHHSAR